nr:hypothetical protein CFP56_29718 [Quercus suber]
MFFCSIGVAARNHTSDPICRLSCWVFVSLILSSTEAAARNHVQSDFHRLKLSLGFSQNQRLGCWVCNVVLR